MSRGQQRETDFVELSNIFLVNQGKLPDLLLLFCVMRYWWGLSINEDN